MDPVPLSHGIIVTPPDSMCIIVLCVAVFLLLCSGFVSASEIAFFSLSPTDLDEIGEEKRSVDRKIEKLLNNAERLLATILICNNFVNIAIIILLDYFFSRVFDFGGSQVLEFILITVILSFLLLLFGEIIPKIYSAQHTLRFCRLAAPTFTMLQKVFYPFSSMLMSSQALTSKIVKYKANALTIDDLEQALELTDKEELKEESRMLEGIIRFSDETVKEIMTPRVDLVDIDERTPFHEVLKRVVETHHSRIPVFNETEDNIKGVLYAKDLLAYVNESDDFKWQRLLRPPYFVPETKMVDDLLHEFQKQKVHIAIVVDEFGGTSGIVTMEDILEEIVGEIDDEYDEERKPFIRLNQCTYLIDGKCLLVDLCRIVGLNDDFFEDAMGDSDTLAGLLLEIKGDFPQLHEKITFRHLTFEVMDMDERRIIEVKVIVRKA